MHIVSLKKSINAEFYVFLTRAPTPPSFSNKLLFSNIFLDRQYRRPLKVTGGGVGGGSKLEQKGVHKDIKKKEELYDHNDLNAKDKETTGNTDTNTANNLRTAKITAIRPSIIPETTLEDIDQILHWRKTSAGIDDNTLAKLILGRGGCVKIPINHSIIKNDKTFEANINVL